MAGLSMETEKGQQQLLPPIQGAASLQLSRDGRNIPGDSSSSCHVFKELHVSRDGRTISRDRKVGQAFVSNCSKSLLASIFPAIAAAIASVLHSIPARVVTGWVTVYCSQEGAD
jgi:hypothetical protein